MISEQRHTAHLQPSLTEPGTARIHQLVMDALGRLEDAGIPYCLLRNRDQIPHGLVQRPVVCLLTASVASHEQLIHLFADLNPVQISRLSDRLLTFFFDVETSFLRLDVYTGDIEWRGAVLLSNSEILAQRQEDNGIMVASLPHQAFISWIERLVKGKFKLKYRPLVMAAAINHHASFRKSLQQAFGPTLAAQLAQLAEAGDMEGSLALKSSCRRALWLHALRHHPRQTIAKTGRHLISAAEARLHPSGLDIALLGPDGAGKTTLCETLAELPGDQIPFAALEYHKLYHRVLPTVGDLESKLRRRPRRPKQDAANPHGKPPHHTAMWFLFESYYTIDRWLGELSWNRHKLAYNNLVLHDRHPLEVTIDPHRYRFGGPLWLARMFARLAPQPDLIILLDAPADVIQSRKSDVSSQETERQCSAYRNLVSALPNGRVVDASQPPELVLRSVISEITAFTAARTRKRFRLPETTTEPMRHIAYGTAVDSQKIAG